MEKALRDIKPSYGINEEELTSYVPKNFIYFSSELKDMEINICKDIERLLKSKTLNSFSILINGTHLSGKSSISGFLSQKDYFPLVKILSGELLIGKGELESASRINDIFHDITKSNETLLILDDIERIVSYSHVGPRFFNAVVQTLMLILNKKQKGKKIFIIGTTSDLEALKILGLDIAFNKMYEMPLVESGGELKTIGETLIEIDDNRINSEQSEFREYMNNNYGSEWEVLI